MKEDDIRDRITDIIADMDLLASDAELSMGEVLIEVALEIVRECTGNDLTVEERNQQITQFLGAIQRKAEAST